MKKLILLTVLGSSILTTLAQTETKLDEITVISIQRNSVNTGSLLDSLNKVNYGQSPDRVIEKLPGIYAYGDNGTSFGYSYFRLRGMDQGRLNVSLDGIPWNEAEDFGCYFSNIPDLMASMKNIKVEKGSSITTSGTAAYAGNISLESIDLKKSKELGTIDIGAGTLDSYRISGSYQSGLLNDGWSYYVRATFLGTEGYREHAYNNSKSISFKIGKYWDKHSLDFFSITGAHKNGQGYQGVLKEQLPKHNTPFNQIINGCNPQETDNFMNTYNRLQYRGVLSENLYLISTLYWTAQKGDYRIGGESYDWLNNYHLEYHTIGANIMTRWYVLPTLTLTSGVNAYYYQRKHVGTELPNDTVIRSYKDKNFPELYRNLGKKPDINIFANMRWNTGKGYLDGSIQYRYTELQYLVDKKGCIEDVPNTHSWDFINGSLGYTYLTRRGEQAYIRWSCIGKEPSRTDLFGGEYFTGEYTIENPSGKEIVNDLEIGYEINRDKIRANLNLYYMSFENELVATGELSPMNGLPLHTQQDGYRMGAELSVTYNPIQKLSITENFSISKNKLENYNTHPFSPTLTNYSEISYNFGKIEVGVTALYHSKVWLDIENKYKLPDMFSLGTWARWQMTEKLSWTAQLNNITNRVNLTNGSVYDDKVYYIIDAPFTGFINLQIKL